MLWKSWTPDISLGKTETAPEIEHEIEQATETQPETKVQLSESKLKPNQPEGQLEKEQEEQEQDKSENKLEAVKPSPKKPLFDLRQLGLSAFAEGIVNSLEDERWKAAMKVLIYPQSLSF